MLRRGGDASPPCDRRSESRSLRAASSFTFAPQLFPVRARPAQGAGSPALSRARARLPRSFPILSAQQQPLPGRAVRARARRHCLCRTRGGDLQRLPLFGSAALAASKRRAAAIRVSPRRVLQPFLSRAEEGAPGGGWRPRCICTRCSRGPSTRETIATRWAASRTPPSR